MHEQLFAQAALPAPARVLGLALRPYSLGHELWLMRENNPFALQWDKEASAVEIITALPAAVLICSETFAGIQAMNRDPWIAWKLWLWRRRVARMNQATELEAFLAYQREGALDFPGEVPTRAAQSRPLGAPFLLRLHQFVALHLGKGELAAWDYPLGLARMQYAAHCEAEGGWLIRGEYETEYDKARDEWMKEHPGNTLQEVSNA